MNFPTLPPIGIPTTVQIHQFIKHYFPEKPLALTEGDQTLLSEMAKQKQENSLNPMWAKGAQVAFFAFRLMDLHPQTAKFSGIAHFFSAIYDLANHAQTKGFLSLARSTASLMGYGGYLVFADIAVVVTKEIDLGNQSLWK